MHLEGWELEDTKCFIYYLSQTLKMVSVSSYILKASAVVADTSIFRSPCWRWLWDIGF